MDLNRRKFMTVLGGTGAYMAGQVRDGATGYGLGWGADKFFMSIVGETPFQYEERAKDIARNMFFGDGGNFAIFPAYNNPLTHNERFNGQRMTKPTAYASQCLHALLPEGSSVQPQEEILIEDITNKWIVILGSPQSNDLSRLLFDNSEDNSELPIRQSRSDLHFPFQFSKAVLTNGEPIKMRRALDDPGKQVNALLESTPSGYRQLVPEMNNDVLQEDFAVITSIPSFQTESDYVNGRRIVNFCGLHGFGTHSLDAILKSETLLQELKDKAKGFEAWQAKIRVADLDHASNKPRFVWTDPVVRPIEGNFKGIAERFARNTPKT